MCKTPWLRSPLCLGWLNLPFKVKFNLKFKFTQFWACPRAISHQLNSRFPKMHFSIVKIPIDFGLDWSSFSFSFSKPFFLPNFASLIHLLRSYICRETIVSECSISHMAEGSLTTHGPVFCLLFGVSSDYAQPITGQVTEITCPVIGLSLLRVRYKKKRAITTVNYTQVIHRTFTFGRSFIDSSIFIQEMAIRCGLITILHRPNCIYELITGDFKTISYLIWIWHVICIDRCNVNYPILVS